MSENHEKEAPPSTVPSCTSVGVGSNNDDDALLFRKIVEMRLGPNGSGSVVGDRSADAPSAGGEDLEKGHCSSPTRQQQEDISLSNDDDLNLLDVVAARIAGSGAPEANDINQLKGLKDDLANATKVATGVPTEAQKKTEAKKQKGLKDDLGITALVATGVPTEAKQKNTDINQLKGLKDDLTNGVEVATDVPQHHMPTLQRDAIGFVHSIPGAYHVAHPDANPVVPDQLQVDDSDMSEQQDASETDEEEGTSDPMAPLEATVVGRRRRKKGPISVRASLTVESVEAARVKDSSRYSGPLRLVAVIFLVGVVIALLALGLSGAFESSKNPDTSSSDASNAGTTGFSNDDAPVKSTLEIIKEEGVLKCGYRPIKIANGDIEGFLAAICQVVSAAIFGPSAPVEFVDRGSLAKFEGLVEKKIHLETFGNTHNMGRDVFRSEVQTGFKWSIPFMYAGMRLAGDPKFLRCAENKWRHLEECEALGVCVWDGSSYHKTLTDILPRRNIVVMEDIAQTQQALINGTCNVVTGSAFIMATEEAMREAGYKGDYEISNGTFSKEPIAVATREDDPEWSDFVNAVIMALFVAEKHNITKDTATLFPQTTLFGGDYTNMFRNAIGYAGNYGEMWEHFLEWGVPRNSLNRINDGTSGLLYSHPIKEIGDSRGSVPLGERLTNIRERGHLNCGVLVGRPGFAEKSNDSSLGYTGMDIDYCRALAGSLFQGFSKSNINVIELTSNQDGFVQLQNGTIDVYAGATWNLENDVHEPTTGLGFAFSKPYFFYPMEGNFALATMQDDHDWSAFVYWVVDATVHAEEHNITQQTSNDMPEVLVFGESLHRMFRDAILEVGNYQEIYSRNVNQFIPRVAVTC
ncbi:extracellular solute-binding protein [Seminavis robusta]|uniref:Extracellular solute-binding protein n=1 Tax=Seminavis robusta TaxID=568900 RepID=A0A9N8H8F4_9STRA|nr:extracellular solute-binding protein [Seminavis robusta]|eukprot:Sro238_g095580.1 extracellular solute-binding protein (863) ;mRNA; f:49361-52123